MAILRKNISKGYEPQTQADIVAQKFPREDTRIATFKAEHNTDMGIGSLPALSGDFNDEDQFTAFTINTMRMRRCYEWQYTACDPGKELQWRSVLNARSASRLDLQAQAEKAADVIFSQENCLGIRISVENGIEAAFSNEVPAEDPTLVLTYRRI